jgi:hypothetical protein
MPRKKINQLLIDGTLLDLGNTLSDEDLLKIDGISNANDIAIASSNIKYAISTKSDEISNVSQFVSKTTNSTVRMRGCAYGNGIYVIVGTSGAIQYSTNSGETWNIITSFTSNVIVSVAYGGGYFICVDSAGGIFKTTNCVEWVQLESPITDIINAIVYVNGKFAFVGANGLIAFSNDATNFNLVNSGTTNELTSITRGLDKYVAVSTVGDILVSINGIDWENKSVDTTHYRTATFGKNLFVIGGASGKIKYSTDAINWIDATHDSTSSVNYIRDIKYANGKFYAVMYISTGAGEIWTSLDGKTWAKTQSTSARLWCLGYGNDILFASGDNGAIWVLNQAIDWFDTQPAIEGEQYIWEKSMYYLTDGSIIEGEVESLNAISELNHKILNTGGGQTIYDLVIRTQEEFDAFCDTLDNGTSTACSVLLVGSSDMTPFMRENGRGLKLPDHLTVFHGINSPIIIINNYVYNPTTNRAGMYRDSLTGQGWLGSIQNINLAMIPGESVAYNQCYHFMNLAGLKNCSIMTGELAGSLPSGKLYIGFQNCAKIENCGTLLVSNNRMAISFSSCQMITNCTTANADIGSGTAISYSACKYIVNAVDDTVNYGYNEPTMYDETCKNIGATREDIQSAIDDAIGRSY